MGHGNYSSLSRGVRADSLGYATKPKEEIFTQTNMDNAMNPKGVGIRESRDSEEHPVSLAIILALDVTGSMGDVPHFLVKEGLPHIMDSLIQKGIADPQVLFLGIGDHKCDNAPLQVSQFESSDDLLDKWLTDIWLEGMGGGNGGESYMLAWYFAARHTSIDCLEKREHKGFLFTVGDEPVHAGIGSDALKRIMGAGEYQDYSSRALCDAAAEKYHVFHINVGETLMGHRPEVVDGWKTLLDGHSLAANSRESVAQIVVDTVARIHIEEDNGPVRVIRDDAALADVE